MKITLYNGCLLKKRFLRASKYPTYKSARDDLLVGVELEYLIENVDEPHVLLNKEDALALYKYLTSDCGFEARTLSDPFRVGMETEMGYITLKPDFAYHLVEISLPPRKRAEDLELLIHSTLNRLDLALTHFGYRRAAYSTYPTSTIQYDMVQTERLIAFMDYARSIKSQQSPFSNPNYPALISSVQVHLNILSDGFFSLLPYLYEPEWKVISLFSNSTTFDGRFVGCARILFYEATLGNAYYLKTMPEVVPTSWEEYAKALDRTPRYDSNDQASIPRDYSLIRPREFGSVEFRSACSQVSVSAIMAICAFRVLQFSYATLARQQGDRLDEEAVRNALFKWAETPAHLLERGPVEDKVDLLLNNAMMSMPREWHRYLPDEMK
jgi:hypothetical protein